MLSEKKDPQEEAAAVESELLHSATRHDKMAGHGWVGRCSSRPPSGEAPSGRLSSAPPPLGSQA
ncbi:hypothetical protein EYF80_046430 [Liparis tanakae]|uniref:Uncharacterized protein n=1 Tax=Liparis tanakae TaxID=230148 RepID=A0A4Z2FQE7_9TELE|nr:hypothetical protein EYF80_046430 [Liparis tanakae]